VSQSTSCNNACSTAKTWWDPPTKLPGSSGQYTFNITSSINPTTDFASLASVACAPSGSGELVPSNLEISTQVINGVLNTILTVTLSGGQQNRIYTTQFLVTMTDGQIYEFLVYLEIPVIIPGDLYVVPPSADFGTPVTTSAYGPVPVQQFSLIAIAVSSNQQIPVALPPNAIVDYAVIRNLLDDNVSVSLGTTLGASDVFTAQPVPPATASTGTITITTEAFLKNWFSATLPQLLYATSSNWTSTVNIEIVYHITA
jgi:hypothetical protein